MCRLAWCFTEQVLSVSHPAFQSLADEPVDALQPEENLNVPMREVLRQLEGDVIMNLPSRSIWPESLMGFKCDQDIGDLGPVACTLHHLPEPVEQGVSCHV